MRRLTGDGGGCSGPASHSGSQAVVHVHLLATHLSAAPLWFMYTSPFSSSPAVLKPLQRVLTSRATQGHP